MIKILHSADWHLDSPIQGRTPEQTALLRRALLQIPQKVAAVCRQEGCQLVLLSGDLFDGNYSQDSYRALYDAMQEMAVPVFIAPGNHDPAIPGSPWLTEVWPENVHIFKHAAVESVVLPALDCRVYGFGFEAMACPGLLENFRADRKETYTVGVFHGDATQINSPYCPITALQVEQSGLQYMALGHIHKGDSFRRGDTLCAWPGCAMGRGYDEQGNKGVLIVTLETAASIRAVSLDAPRFYDLEIPAEEDALAAISAQLPPAGSEDFYRITLTGPSEPPDIPTLKRELQRFPNLELRDKTVPPLDVWGSAGEDTFEGIYFKLLKEQLADQDERTRRQILLAARISRQLLEKQEVQLQ